MTSKPRARRTVLAIASDRVVAGLLRHSLHHQRIQVICGDDEQAIVAALTEQPLDLVLIGDSVGRRSPRQLHAAVRVRSKHVPIMYVITERSLFADIERPFPEGTAAIDLSPHWQLEPGMLVDGGWQLRADVLQRFAIAEDSESAVQWVRTFLAELPKPVPALPTERHHKAAQPPPRPTAAEDAESSAAAVQVRPQLPQRSAPPLRVSPSGKSQQRIAELEAKLAALERQVADQSRELRQLRQVNAQLKQQLENRR